MSYLIIGGRRMRRKKNKTENLTILPLDWVKKLIKKTPIKKLIITWPRQVNSGEWVEQQLLHQGKLREELKKETKTNKIYLKNIWNRLKIPEKNQRLSKPDYYAFLMACLIREDLDNCNSWPDVSLKTYNWDGSKNIRMLVNDMNSEELVSRLANLENLCGCSNPITRAYPVSHRKLYKKEDFKKAGHPLEYPRIALVGCDCIKKDIIDTIIQVTEILDNYIQYNDDDDDDYSDNINRLNLIIDEGELKDNEENITAMKYVVEFLEKLKKKGNKEDNIELRDKIKKDGEFKLHISKLKGMVAFLRKKGLYELNPLDAMVTKLINDDSMNCNEKLKLINIKFKHKRNKNTVIKKILYNETEKLDNYINVSVNFCQEPKAYEKFIDKYYEKRNNLAETINGLPEDIIPEKDMDSIWNNLNKNEKKFKNYHKKEQQQIIKNYLIERKKIIEKGVGKWTIKYNERIDIPIPLLGLKIRLVYNMKEVVGAWCQRTRSYITGEEYLEKIYNWSHKFKSWHADINAIDEKIKKWRKVNTYLLSDCEE